MLKFLNKISHKKSAHMIEYCALIALVALGIILMRDYVYRSVFAHLKMWEDGAADTLSKPKIVITNYLVRFRYSQNGAFVSENERAIPQAAPGGRGRQCFAGYDRLIGFTELTACGTTWVSHWGGPGGTLNTHLYLVNWQVLQAPEGASGPMSGSFYLSLRTAYCRGC
jgi:hypothetical protein